MIIITDKLPYEGVFLLDAQGNLLHVHPGDMLDENLLHPLSLRVLERRKLIAHRFEIPEWDIEKRKMKVSRSHLDYWLSWGERRWRRLRR